MWIEAKVKTLGKGEGHAKNGLMVCLPGLYVFSGMVAHGSLILNSGYKGILPV